MTVHCTLGGTAASGLDYAALSGSVVLGAGVSSTTLTVYPLADTLIEGTEAVLLNLSTDPAYLLGQQASAAIDLADTPLPEVSLQVTTAQAREFDEDWEKPAPGIVTVTRTGSTARPLTVRYTVTGTATGADVEALSGEVVIPAGESQAFVTITPVLDNANEEDETVISTLLADPTSTVASTTAATVTLADAPLPTVVIDASGVNASEPTGGPAARPSVFTLTRKGPSKFDLVVPYTVSDTTAAGLDCTALSGTVTIPAGSRSAEIVVTPLADDQTEGDEKVTLTLDDSDKYTRGSATAASVLVRFDSMGGGLPASAGAAGLANGLSGAAPRAATSAPSSPARARPASASTVSSRPSPSPAPSPSTSKVRPWRAPGTSPRRCSTATASSRAAPRRKDRSSSPMR